MSKKILLATVCIALWGCDASESTEAASAHLPEGCDQLIEPGEDDHGLIQTALIEAEAGTTVCLAEGTFTFETELSISVDGLTLKGAGQDLTILDFSAQDLGANGIHVTSDGVTVEAFTVMDTPGDGIWQFQFEDVLDGVPEASGTLTPLAAALMAPH